MLMVDGLQGCGGMLRKRSGGSGLDAVSERRRKRRK
jgi:hypothetical protein